MLLVSVATAATLVLCWAALIGAGAQTTLPTVLQPTATATALLIMLLWIAALASFWWPRRRQNRPIGLLALAGLALIAAIAGLSAVVPCDEPGDAVLTPLWHVSTLFVGTTPGLFGPESRCSAGVPLALQLARFAAMAAVFGTAIAVGLSVAREQVRRVVARVRRFDELVIGIDDVSLPLVRTLLERSSTRRIAVIGFEGQDEAAADAHQLGALVFRASTMGLDASSSGRNTTEVEQRLKPFVVTRGRAGVRRVWIMHPDPTTAEELALVVKSLFEDVGFNEVQQRPRLMVRFDDRRLAETHRARWTVTTAFEDTSGSAAEPVMDAICIAEVTATEVLGRIAVHEADQADYRLVLCGDSALAETLLLEAAGRWWEAADFDAAWNEHLTKPRGHAETCAPDADCRLGWNPGADPDDLMIGGRLPAQVVVVSPFASSLVDQALHAMPATFASAAAGRISAVDADWRGSFALPHDQLSSHAVIADALGPHEGHLVGRLVGRLSGTVWVNRGSAAVGDSGLPRIEWFSENVLLRSALPEDPWERIARHIHERYRRAHYQAGNAKRLPWWHSDPQQRLGQATREDNVEQVRLLLASVAGNGYEWRWRHDAASPTIPDHEAMLVICKREYERWCRAARQADPGRALDAWSPDGTPHAQTEESIVGVLGVLAAYGYVAELAEGEGASQTA